MAHLMTIVTLPSIPFIRIRSIPIRSFAGIGSSTGIGSSAGIRSAVGWSTAAGI